MSSFSSDSDTPHPTRSGRLLTRCLAADPASNFPQPAIEHLRRIPVIVLDPKSTHTSQIAKVAITTASYGISVGGTVYRMDDVPLTLRPALPSPYPSDESVLQGIKERVSALIGGNRMPAMARVGVAA